MELSIHFHDQTCGTLHIDQGRMRFAYLPAYIAAGGPPISVAMPCSQQIWPDARAFPFFENLLPEGTIRQLLANRLGTAENNFSRLLQATGGDVAGAISIGGAATPTRTALPPALSDQALGQVLEQIKTEPFLPDNQHGMRLSLAGAQNKLPVVIDDKDAIHLPGQHASTHIIKPPSERFPGLVENEYLCMRAASRAGLNVPPVTVRNFVAADGQHHDCYVIQRYDRHTPNGVTLRLHQEDVCQIAGVVSAQKYAQDGGPGFRELFDVLRTFTKPSALHQQELIKRLLFNLLIGNQDAHAKNFSLLHTQAVQSLPPQGSQRQAVVLAPAYDLVCTLVYPQLQNRFAMPVGQAWTIKDLDKAAREQFQVESGVNLRRQTRTLQRFVDSALNAIEVEAKLIKPHAWPQSHQVMDQILALARGHAEKLRQWL